MSTRSTRSSFDVLTSTRPKFPEGLQVLLVDNSADQHTLQLLTDLHYSVTLVESAADAVSTLNRMSVDVILADMSLVGDLTSQDAKALFTAAGKVPVLLMGVKCSSSQVLAAVKHGAADFMEKPLSQLKLRNIWQHTVRMMMHTCDSRSHPSSPAAAEAAAELMAKHDAAAVAAAAAAAVAFAPNVAGSPGQPAEQLGRLSAEDDCFKAPELSPLLSSRLNMDPEMIFLDLDTQAQPNEPSLDDILQPYTPSGSAAAEEFSTEQMVTNSSGQYGSGTTGVTAFPGELESCADTSSRMGGSSAPALGSRVTGLRTRASMRGLAASGDWQQPAAQPASAAIGTAHSLGHQHLMPAPGCPVPQPASFGTWMSSWGAPTGVKGMVWGMPVFNVARAPGLVVPNSGQCNKDIASSKGSCAGSTSASAASSPTHKGNTTAAAAATMTPAAAGYYYPWLMPQTLWPMMPMMGMPPAATGPAPAAGHMQMYPGMYPGSMPPMMGPMGMPMMGMPGVPPMGMPGMWPATATASRPAAAVQPQPPSGATTAAACVAPVKLAPAHPPAPMQDVSTNSEDAAGTWQGVSIDGGGSAAGDEFVSGLFVEEPRTAGWVPGASEY